MRSMLGITAALILCGGMAGVSAHAAEPAKFQLTETTWTFTDKDGSQVIESIDATGNYTANTADGKHLDHGTAVMKDDKVCFTSAMTSEAGCWTTEPVKIGDSLVTTNDKGEKLKVTRVKYTALGM